MNLIKKLSVSKRIYKFYILFFTDVCLSLFSLYLTLSILEQKIIVNIFSYPTLIFFTSLTFLPIFYSMDMYKNVLRYSNFYLIFQILFCVIINFFILFFLNYFLSFFYLNFTIFLLFSTFFFIFLVNSRILIIYLIEELNKSRKKFALIYGAGEAGSLILKKIKDYKVLFFIDDDLNKIDRKIDSIKIISSKKLDFVIKENSVSCIFLAIPSIDINNRQKILSELIKYNVEIKILPRIDDILFRNYEISNFNFLFSDLFTRNIKWNQEKFFTKIEKKCILVTGAGGSIGSELVRQLTRLNIYKLICIDKNEFNLFNISQEISRYIQKTNKVIKIKYYLSDLTDYNRIKKIFTDDKPDIVYHTAAYKHVNLLENNKIESLFNNVYSTLNLAKLSNKFAIKHLINISTDKAIRPSNVMGASKRLSELILLNFKNDNTKTSIVRFGNVINSNGSVIPLFNKQIQEGGPVTVTNKDVSRYFMSIEEAVCLVLESTFYSRNKDIFILDMGNPIKILDLAIKMINLAGKKHTFIDEKDHIKIIFTGLKKGEKLHESLSYENKFSKTENKYILRDEAKNDQTINIYELEQDIIKIKNNQNSNEVTVLYKKYLNNNLL